MHSGKTKHTGDFTHVGVTHIWYGRGGKQKAFCPCLEWNPGFLASSLSLDRLACSASQI